MALKCRVCGAAHDAGGPYRGGPKYADDPAYVYIWKALMDGWEVLDGTKGPEACCLPCRWPRDIGEKPAGNGA